MNNCAIYIDADNVSPKSLEEILLKSSNSNVIIKKIFADWTHESMHKWSKKAKQYGFQGIQCFGNDFKQTSDIYMITDIINDLYSNNHINMIILATSDIDFTHLCHLIKAKNKKLVIFTPQKSSIVNLTNNNIKPINLNIDNKPINSNIDNKPKKKKQKIVIKSKDKKLEYLTTAMKDSISVYVSNYKKNLKKTIPKDYHNIDMNNLEDELNKYPKHFGLIKNGNKLKIYGLFHLLKYSENDFQENKSEIEFKYQEIFKVYDYNMISNNI